MRHILIRVLSAVAIVAFTASLALAQTAPTPPSTPATPSGAVGTPPPMPVIPPVEKSIDGAVKRIDPLAKTVSVGWFLGLFSTTLEVTEETRIVVDGATGSLQDIREGDVVKAAYEAHINKNIAKSIEVTEPEPRRGADAPSTGAPKTP